MNKREQRLRQIEHRLLNGTGSMPENIDQYTERLLFINNVRWLSFIAIAITVVVIITNN